MDFNIIRALTSNFSQLAKKNDGVVLSCDRFSLYLLIIDKASQYAWVFLAKTKEPPIKIIDAFMARFGHEWGGSI
jgi:hypothetical protein